MRAEGYLDKWICYRSAAVSAKELTILPGRSVLVKDAAAYGMIVTGTWDNGRHETGNARDDPLRTTYLR